MARKMILLVDDDPLSLKLEKIVLSVDKYAIYTATDAEEALKVLESFTPDLILMNIRLPGMNGLELTRKIKSIPKYKNIIILAVTGNAIKGNKEQAFAAGVDGYITKPIDIKTIPNLIESYLTNND